MRAPTAAVPCDRCGRHPSLVGAGSSFSYCRWCGLYVCARCWTPRGRCRSCALPAAGVPAGVTTLRAATQSGAPGSAAQRSGGAVVRVAAPGSRHTAASRHSGQARPARRDRRVARSATDGLGFRLVLATLLAIGAMFGAWALDLTLRDALLSPAANVPAENVPAATFRLAPAAAP